MWVFIIRCPRGVRATLVQVVRPVKITWYLGILPGYPYQVPVRRTTMSYVRYVRVPGTNKVVFGYPRVDYALDSSLRPTRRVIIPEGTILS